MYYLCSEIKGADKLLGIIYHLNTFTFFAHSCISMSTFFSIIVYFNLLKKRNTMIQSRP